MRVQIETPRRNLRTTVYENLCGVDFSQGASKVDKKRSPDCINMVSDNGKHPVKRVGWKTVGTVPAGIKNLWINNKDQMTIYTGTGLYDAMVGNTEVTPADKYTDLNANIGKGCQFYSRNGEDQGWFTLAGGIYYHQVEHIEDGAAMSGEVTPYVPVTVIGRSPSGGGTSYENINFLTGKQQVRFTGDATALVYQLPYTDVQYITQVESMQADGSMLVLKSGTDYTINKTLGQVTFKEAKPAPIEGHDNIHITFQKDIEGYPQRILNCSSCATYGVGGSNRVFLTGNKKYKSYVFWSDVWNASYFPDLNFAIVGNPSTAVKGFLKVGENLAIIKEDSPDDTTVFMCSGTMQADGSALFTVKGSVGGVGAVSDSGFGILNDDPMFLSKQGVYAVSLTYMSYDRVTRNRSHFVDAKLKTETKLENACAVVWNGLYIVAVNGRAYVLDGRKTTKGPDGEFRYECWYWENIPATCFAIDSKNRLWFGTADGRICRFKSVEEDGTYAYSDDDKAIKAVWSTPADDDGCIQYFKTLQKNGCLAVLEPMNRSGCKVYFSVDGQRNELVRTAITDTSAMFREVDFKRLSFDAVDVPKEVYFRHRENKYKRLQISLVSDAVNEGLGIYQINKTYEIKQYSRNRR